MDERLIWDGRQRTDDGSQRTEDRERQQGVRSREKVDIKRILGLKMEDKPET